MRENCTSSSMRGCWKRAPRRNALALYSPAEPPGRSRLAEAQRMNMPAREASGEDSSDGAV